MTSRFKTIAIGLGVFGAAFIFGLWLTFPMRLVARVVEAQAEKALGFKYDVSIDRVRFSGISGLRLIGLELMPTGTAPEGEVWLPTRIDSARVNVGLSSLGSVPPRVRADLRVGDGRLEARVAPGDEGGAVVGVELTDFPLQRIDLIRQRTGMPMQGQVSGVFDLTLDDDWTVTAGRIDLTVPGLVAGPGAIRSSALRQVGGSLPISATDLGTLAVQAAIEEGTLSIERIEASGTDVRLEVTGQVELRGSLCSSRVAAQTRFALDSGYVEENALAVPLSNVPLLQRAQTADGYVLSLSGLLCRLRPEAGSMRRGEPDER